MIKINAFNFPKWLNIEISSRCNLKCPLCPRGRNEIIRESSDMDISVFKNIIKEIKQNDTFLYLWNYGESLFHPEIENILEILRRHSQSYTLSTNGHFMSQQLALKILNTEISEIIFAIDGISVKTYEKYRMGGNFKKVINNLDLFCKLKLKNKSDIKVSIQFLALKHNFHEIPKLGKFFSQFNIDEIKVKSAMLMFDINDSRLIDFGKNFLYLNYPGERYSLKNNIFKIRGKRIKGCNVVEQSMIINSDGSILPCCWDAYSSHILGDINKETIEEIWKGYNRHKFLEKLRNGYNYKICFLCPIKNQHTFSWDWNKVHGVNYKMKV